MSNERWVVLGLAHPRAGWFGDLARSATTAAVPVDFIKCMSADEVRARVSGGRAYSALLVGGDVSGLDRDLVASVRATGAAVLVVDPVSERDWAELGVAATLPGDFGRTELLNALSEHASRIARVVPLSSEPAAPAGAGWRGRLIAVTGAGGVGSSIVAMSVAQAFGSEPSNAAMVLLADLALDGEQGMIHDAGEVLPGVQELSEAHGAGRPSIDEVRSLSFDVDGRGYHLLLGLRRHRDWTAIRPRAFAAALDGLLRSYRLVVADIDCDVEGEQLTGSLDIEDRNVMARTVTQRADIVAVVGLPTTKGLHGLRRTIDRLRGEGIESHRIVAVCNRAPRGPRRRSELVRALATLLDDRAGSDEIGNPVFLAERGDDIETAIRDGIRLPPSLGRPLHAELTRRLESLGSRSSVTGPPAPEPTVVAPGSLGSWTEEAG